ncbi:SpoIIE family protein phosphatase [Nocardioides sp. CER19]|uniref:SpoIIE family protein phosphatase n=1 Tax=Nocardioides sp. CER19 TaxID=3038538 RepID=UPI002449FB1B|nr:SpoIIE family protein phosphatase [Nocardioides sp. CER19]MDH2415299.1 SpoIIE family protein phosphatase [Nocardioides sp. CER19]
MTTTSMRETLAAAGRVGRDLLAVDWSSTAIGDPDDWPPALRSAVRTILSTRFAMWMAWGPELTFFCNDAYRRDTLGSKYPWALGRPAREVWAEIWPEIGPRIERVTSTGEATWDEALQLFLERSGYAEETYHTFSYSPLIDDDGIVQGILCVVAEVTDQVVNERRMSTLRHLGIRVSTAESVADAVRAGCDHLASNNESLPWVAAYLFDEDGNATLAGTAGIKPGHAAAPVRIDADDADPVWPVADLATGAHVTVDGVDKQFPDLPTGAWAVPPEKAVIVPLPRPLQEKPYGFLVLGANRHRPVDKTFFDFADLIAGHFAAAITDALAMEQEKERSEALARLDQAKSDFLANVSHELRTPLTLLLGPADDALGDERHPLDDVQRNRVEVISRNATRMLGLVNTLLDFSRLDTVRDESTFQPTDLLRYTTELASMFESAVERAGLELTVSGSLEGEVYVDRGHWAKIVLNLLSNAFKFTFEGGVTITVDREDHHAVLRVTDTGTGIPEAEVPRLFERFHRVRGAVSRSIEGSGIGLALVAELAELHGGDVGVVSRPGEGSTFTVSLPLGSDHLPAEQVIDDADAVPAWAEGSPAPSILQEALGWLDDTPQVGPQPEPPRGEEQATVLVVDDNDDMRNYVAELLADSFGVVTATDGLEALEVLGKAPVDVVITDVMMPRLDGYGLLSRMKQDPLLAAVPVIMLSARAGEEGMAEGLEAGADDYLVKPFAARELLARVKVQQRLQQLQRVASEAERRTVARELAIADELQHSLLPDVEAHTDALEIATFYRPGVEGTQVGGDWYDVINLGGGRTALVIGDVMGRGVRAASVMGQIKAAVRAFARLDLTPGELVENLDGIVQDVAPFGIVTCVYGIYDDADKSLTYANAGHPPPILLRPDGTAIRLPVDGPPLGSGYVGFETRRVELPVGGLLTVYTDGLVERRGTDLGARIDELEAAIVAHRDDPVAELPGTLVELLADVATDDVALAVVKVHDSGSQLMRLPLSENLSAVSTARRAVAAQLRVWEVVGRAVADLVLVTSELVTNSLRHARGPYELRLRRTAHEVVVEVGDSTAQRPRRRRVDGDAESGRGLTIVEAVADRWGSRSTAEGKVVWAARRV